MGRAITARAGSGPARFGSDTSATPAVRAIGSGRPRPASNRGPGAPSALSACLRACATAMRSRRRAELAAERREYSCRGRDLPLIVKVGRRGVRLLGLRQHGASDQCTARREGGRAEVSCLLPRELPSRRRRFCGRAVFEPAERLAQFIRRSCAAAIGARRRHLPRHCRLQATACKARNARMLTAAAYCRRRRALRRGELTRPPSHWPSSGSASPPMCHVLTAGPAVAVGRGRSRSRAATRRGSTIDAPARACVRSECSRASVNAHR